MRITGGEYRGRKIYCPPGTIRPAMDRMREAVFSALGPIDGLHFLDLFSGSGIIALEAASRGAERVHSVEKDPRKRDMLERNLAVGEGRCSYTISPVERFILKRQEPFDVIFLDPPFPYRHKNDLLKKLVASALLKDGTDVCMHYPGENEILEQIVSADGTVSLELIKKKEFGRSMVNFYRAAVKENS